jgi:predicted porin
MYYGAPNAIPNFSTSVNNIVDWNGISGGGAAGLLNPFARLNLGNDTNHISYFTPRFAGFQIGASYSPENLKGGDATGYGTAVPGNAPASTTVPGSVPLERQGGSSGGMICDGASCASNSVQDIFEIAANYVNKFGDVEVGIYGAYNTGDNVNKSPVTNDDPREWGLGASIGYAGFTAGGAYTVKRAVTGLEYKTWNAGVRYVTGPWGIGFEYGNVEQENAAPAKEDEGNHYYLGVTYAMGPGITMWGGVSYHDLEAGTPVAGTKEDNSATILRIGTSLAF